MMRIINILEQLQLLDSMKKKLIILIGILLANSAAIAQCAGATGCPTLAMNGASVSCYGGSNGSAGVTVSGVSAAYLTYNWAYDGSNGTSISGLQAGTYAVTVKNTCTGCTATGYYTVNTPSQLAIATTTQTNVNCFAGNTGLITINISGGTPPYSVSWSNGGSGTTISNLSTGTYTATVTDSKGCQKQKTFVITQPSSPLGSTFTKINVDCFGRNTGSIDLSPFGGTGPYTFVWSPGGQLTEDLQGLYAGSYSVTIKDSKNCTSPKNVQITQPTVLAATIQAAPVTCYGYSNGSVQVLPSGGTSPYSYTWSNSTYSFSQNSPTLSNVPSEIYNVHITDAKGCIAQKTDTVNTPTQITVSNAIITNINCYGESTGKIELAVIGGTVTTGYIYEWSNSSGIIVGATSNILQNIPSGSYSVLIKDNNNCSILKTYQITQPSLALGIITNSVNEVLCYGFNTGSVDVNVYGGTPSYTYSWQNSNLINVGLSEDLAGVEAGEYTLLVTDANNCTTSGIYIIVQPADTLAVSNNITPVLCYNGSTGAVNLTSSGGTSPYSFAWNNSSYLLSVTLEDLINYPSDTYDLVLTDDHGCIYTESYFIPQPTLLTGNLIGTDILCKNEATGAVDLTVQGGVLPYNFLWNNLSTTEDISSLPAGDYSVIVTDANFCTFSAAITITEPSDTLGYQFTTVDVSCHGFANGEINLIASGGSPLYSLLWTTGDTNFYINNLTAGYYSFNLTDNNGCLVFDSLEIFQPDLLLANYVVTPVTCKGLGDGRIDITPTGGISPYTYSWYNSNFALSAQVEDLVDFPFDTYQLELRDSFNCLTEVFILLDEPDELVATANTIDATCFGESNGSIDVEVTGGNPGYTYLWSNGTTNQDATNLTSGEYSVMVTDTKNCQDSLTIVIYEPEPVTISFDIKEVTCADQFNGEIYAYPSGGTGDFTYNWKVGSADNFITDLYGGYYSVLVTDIVGCEKIDSAFVPTNSQDCIQPPNAFTPNNDLYNDTWHLENIGIYPEADVKVFNRWGELIYHQSNPDEEWDAIHNGQPLPSETYYYTITLSSKNKPVMGAVTIIR
jgi:gliding motility-associated-like protein|tara:strand:- start:13519 stop:16734 length:3216 start_codon:yes stop_codon:yes gene_type:complete